MKVLFGLGILAAGEVGDLVTTYLGQTHGLVEINPIILGLHLNWLAFVVAKLLPVVIIAAVAFQYPRLRQVAADCCLFAGGALTCVTLFNLLALR